MICRVRMRSLNSSWMSRMWICITEWLSEKVLKQNRRSPVEEMEPKEVELQEMNIILRIPENAVFLEVKASLMDENGELMNVMKKLPVQDIFKARQDFLQNVEDGDEYDARYVLTDEGREYLNSLLEAEDGND